MKKRSVWHGFGRAMVGAAPVTATLLAGCATTAPPNMGPEGYCDSPPPNVVRQFPPIFINSDAVGQALTRELSSFEEGYQGGAEIQLLVDERGRVADSKVETSTGSPEVDRAILRAFRLARFRAGTSNCEPVEKWMKWSVAPSWRRSG